MRWLILLAGLLGLPVCAVTSDFSSQEIAFMEKVYRGKLPASGPEATRRYLMENQFLLSEAERLAPQLLVRQSPVGFSTDYHVRRYLLELWQAQGLLANASPVTLADTAGYDAKWLKATLGSYPPDGVLSKQRQNRLAGIKLALSNGEKINLLALYNSLSMQSRFRLHGGDSALLIHELGSVARYKAATQVLAPRFAKEGIQLAHLYDIAVGDMLRPTLLGYLGVQPVMHEESPQLERFAASVSDEEIRRYYLENRARFRFLAKIRAFGALFEQREDALAFREYAESRSFSDALHHFNVRDLFADKDNRLSRQNGSDWYAQVAFSVPEDSLSQPLRTPEGSWFVANSREHEYEHYPWRSETVRYHASKALARDKARLAYTQARDNWLAVRGVKP